MARMIGELQVGLSLKVDGCTAKTALLLVELYINQTGLDVIGNREEDGTISLQYCKRHTEEE